MVQSVVLSTKPNSPEQHVGGFEGVTIRTNLVFTSSYVSSAELDISNCKTILLLLLINGTTITDSQLRIQFAEQAKGAWFDLTHLHMDTDTVANNPSILPTVFEMGGSTVNIAIPIVNPGASFLRCQVKANTGSGACAIIAVRGQGAGSFPVAFGGAVA